MVRIDRPNMFINELGMYLKYFSEKIKEHKENWTIKSAKQLNNFADNMNHGLLYYQEMYKNKRTKSEKFESIDSESIKNPLMQLITRVLLSISLD